MKKNNDAVPVRAGAAAAPRRKAGVKGTGAREPGATARPESAPRPAHVSGATSSNILEAALAVFARDGFDGASLPAIAKAASTGHPLIHYHFGSKENLWRAAVDHAFGDLAAGMATLQAAAADLSPVDALRLLLRGFAQFTARHPLHTLIILNEVRSGGDRFDWIVERHLRPLHQRLDRTIEAAVASGQIKAVPTAHLASIVVGATAHFFSAQPLLARLYGIDVQAPETVAAHADWVVEVLMNGLVQRSETAVIAATKASRAPTVATATSAAVKSRKPSRRPA
jgi:TetR/AcrR family transcriptional regulator